MPRPSEEIDVQAAKEVYATLPEEQKSEIEALVARGHNRRSAMMSVLKQDMARGRQGIKDVEETTTGERVGAGLLGAANTMSFNLADEVRGLATAIPRLVPGGESPIDAYVRGRDAQREEAKAAETRNLKSTLGGEVAGNIPSLVGGFAAKVPQAITTAAKQGVGALAKEGAKIGAAGGAVGGFGAGEGLVDSIKQMLFGGGVGGVLGGVGGGLGGLASAETRAASSGAKPAAPAPASSGPGIARRGAAAVVDLAGKAVERAPMAAGAALGGGVGGPVGAAAGGAIGQEFGGAAGKAMGGRLAQLAQRLRGDAAPDGSGIPWQPATGSSTADAPSIVAPAHRPPPPATPVDDPGPAVGVDLLGELSKRLDPEAPPAVSTVAEEPSVTVDEGDIVAAIPEQSWDKGVGAVEKLKDVQKGRDFLAEIAAYLNEEDPARATFFKKEIQSGAADPARVAAKTEELLAAGKNPQQIAQALAVRRTQETGDLARIAKHEGGEEMVDTVVAMMIAKGAKTKGEIQDMTGLGIREIDKALARHKADLDRGTVKKPNKASALPVEEGGKAGPENTLWEPVYEEIIGEPWSAVNERLTGKSAASVKLPQSHTEYVTQDIITLREPDRNGVRLTPVQIAKAISQKTGVEYTPDMIRAVLKSRQEPKP